MGLFRKERRRDRSEIPVRYWAFVALLAVSLVVLTVTAVGLLLGIIAFERSSPPTMSGRAELWMLLVMFSPLFASMVCFMQARRRVKPDSTWDPAKRFLPPLRHLTRAGVVWLIASYLWIGVFIAFVCMVGAIVALVK